MRKTRSYVLAGVMVLLAVSCGGSDDSTDDDAGDVQATAGATTAPPSTTAPNTTVTAGNDTATTTTAASDDDGGTEPPGQPDVGETGSFTVNGTEFAVTTLNRCVPFQDAPGNVDLQALAGGAKLNLVRFGGVTEVSVDGSTINEMFGSIAFGEAPVVAASDIAGDRWTGSATVGDSLGSSESVAVTWDVMVPAEARDCSL